MLTLQKMTRMMRVSPWKVWQEGRGPLFAASAPMLTPAMSEVVLEAKSLSGDDIVVANDFGIKVTASDLERMQGKRWLNYQLDDIYLEVRSYICI